MLDKALFQLKYFLILTILFLFFSCVEHKFIITISPEGKFLVEYSAHGDKMDLQDHDFPMPSGHDWIIHSTMEKIEAESYDYSAHKTFKRNEKFPTTFYIGDSIKFSSLLKHPTEIKHFNWFFHENFYFNIKYQGRQADQKYPLISQLLISKDDPPAHWLHEALGYILSETVRQTPLEWNIKPIIESELKDWIENDLESVNDSILFEELDYYKNLGLDIIMQPAPPILYSTMDSIFKILEDELKITMDLDSDSFLYKLILPGELQTSNADSLSGDTLIWSFDLIDYMNDDFVMAATSSIIHTNRKKIGIFFCFTLGIFFVYRNIKNKNF